MPVTEPARVAAEGSGAIATAVLLTLGLLFGALVCASMLGGDVAHAAVVHVAVAPQPDVAGHHTDHSRGGHAAMDGALPAGEGDRPNGHEPGPAGSTAGHDHPGMACLTTIDLAPRHVVVVARSHAWSAATDLMEPGCSRTPEPPVPRRASFC